MTHLRYFAETFVFIGLVCIFQTLLRYERLFPLGQRTGDPEGQGVVIPGEAIVIGPLTRVLNP